MFFGYVYMIFRFTNAKCNSIIKEQICTCADIFLLDLNITSVLTKDTTDGKHGPLYKKFQGRGVK